MTLPLDKSITIQGAGQDKTIIKGAILVNGSANNTATDVKIKGLSIDYTPTKVTSGKCTPIIEVTGNADLLIIHKAMVIVRTQILRKHYKMRFFWEQRQRGLYVLKILQ